jgi:predicted RNA-binding Zn ribbon-like protein
MRGNEVHNSDWKHGFLFLGNQLVLDFLNTRPIQNGKSTELLSDFPAVVRWFQASGLLGSREAVTLRKRWGESARARHTVESIRALREELRKEVIAWEADAKVHRVFIEQLNVLLAAHPMIATLKQIEDGTQMHSSFEAVHPEDLFAPLAYAAAQLFTEEDRTRVRKCGHCVLHFLDISKKGTRRWCSMQLCGNRLKVAAYAARKSLKDA